MNDAYLGAWNAIPPARPNPLLSYIAKIVRNCSLKAYWRGEAAKRNSRFAVAVQESSQACIADPKTVEGEIEAGELARMIEGLFGHAGQKRPGHLHAPLRVFGRLFRHSGGRWAVRKKRVCPADPHPPEDEAIPAGERGGFVSANLFFEAVGELGDRYYEEAARYRRGRAARGWGKWAVAACLAVAAAAALSVLPSFLNRQGAPPPIGPGGDLSPGAPEIRIGANSVFLNDIAGFSDAARRRYDPALYDWVEWGREEVTEYYGGELTPAYIPAGLIASPQNGTAVVIADKSGSVVLDTVCACLLPGVLRGRQPQTDRRDRRLQGHFGQGFQAGAFQRLRLPSARKRGQGFGHRGDGRHIRLPLHALRPRTTPRPTSRPATMTCMSPSSSGGRYSTKSLPSRWNWKSW